MNEQNQSEHMSVYEIPVVDIAPNPYQPRLEFDDMKLSSMADSIARYGVMQPIVVTKKPDGSFELISGERRLRASKLAGKETIPAVVRDYEHSDEEKFELAIIENIQREDLSPADKAKAFEKLSNQFGYTHSEIAQKMGKSREYISNALRLLLLPDNMLHAMGTDALTEGHARPLLMLKDRPFEQGELFKKIVEQKLTVRAAEKIARSIATEKLRKLDIDKSDPEIKVMEKKLAEKLGTKVHIDEKTVGEGGKLTIEYFSKEDLEKIIELVKGNGLSAVPDLGPQKDTGMEKFQNNFADEKINTDISVGKQILQSAPAASVFADEIQNLTKKPSLENANENPTVKINLEPTKPEEGAENIDGYNISFGAPAVKEIAEEKIPEEQSTQFTQETDPVDDAATENIDNFSTQNWKEKEKEDIYQSELDAVIAARQGTQVADNGASNLKAEEDLINSPQKHDITELSLGKEEEALAESLAMAKVAPVNTTPLSKEDFMLQMRKEQQNIQEETPAIVHENIGGQDLRGKTEAQQRIDDILAGKKTVSEEYGFEQGNQQVEKNRDRVQEVIAQKQPEENIEDTSVYQQFLESKKKIEDQKDRMFSGENDNEVNNVGSFSGETSEFTNNISSHAGSEMQQVDTLKQERDIKSILQENFAGEKEEENAEKQEGINEAKVENIFGGSSFVPKSGDISDVADKVPENTQGPQPVDGMGDKYSFKGFSI